MDVGRNRFSCLDGMRAICTLNRSLVDNKRLLVELKRNDGKANFLMPVCVYKRFYLNCHTWFSFFVVELPPPEWQSYTMPFLTFPFCFCTSCTRRFLVLKYDFVPSFTLIHFWAQNRRLGYPLVDWEFGWLSLDLFYFTFLLLSSIDNYNMTKSVILRQWCDAMLRKNFVFIFAFCKKNIKPCKPLSKKVVELNHPICTNQLMKIMRNRAYISCMRLLMWRGGVNVGINWEKESLRNTRCLVRSLYLNPATAFVLSSR